MCEVEQTLSFCQVRGPSLSMRYQTFCCSNGFKVYGKYPKYELITSHICRRSFCTNLFGKVPNQVIMDVQGWKSESQMYDYNQQTNRESAIKLKAHWDKIKN